jgi:hypothetical protein
MTPRTRILGLLSNLLLAAACATGGVTGATEMRSDTRPGNVSKAETIPRWTCTPGTTAVAPADGLISDFSDKGGVSGKLFTSVPPDALPGVSMSQVTDAGRLVLDVKAVPGPKPQVLTATRVFDGCVDARGFAGIQFSLSGTLSGCSMTYATIDPAHQYCEADGPYPPQKKISADEVTSVPRIVSAPFQRPEIQGNPATPVDAGQLAAIQWIVIVPVAPDDGSAATPCAGKIFIDDVRLYR